MKTNIALFLLGSAITINDCGAIQLHAHFRPPKYEDNSKPVVREKIEDETDETMDSLKESEN